MTSSRPAAAARRLLRVPLVVTVVCATVFVVLDLLPGDVASQRLGGRASPEALAALRHDLGLDRPVLVRLWEWLGGLAHGDLGTVFGTGAPVSQVLGPALGRSALLGLVAGAGILALGTLAGTLAGLRRGGRTDRAISATALAAVCTPEFVVATLLVLLLATGLHLLPAVSLVPVGGSVADAPQILVLPALTMIMVGAGSLARQVRPVVARADAAEHVEAARLAGLPERVVILRHLLPTALGPVAQAVAATVPYVIGGAVVVERVFSYPGVGTLLVEAVTAREPYPLMATVLVVSCVTVSAYLLADVVGGRSREVIR